MKLNGEQGGIGATIPEMRDSTKIKPRNVILFLKRFWMNWWPDAQVSGDFEPAYLIIGMELTSFATLWRCHAARERSFRLIFPYFFVYFEKSAKLQSILNTSTILENSFMNDRAIKKLCVI